MQHNCLIARSNAPEIPAERWFAMMRLDENRAKTQLAKKAKVPVSVVTNMAIWGNHSSTQYPDAKNARIAGLGAYDVNRRPRLAESRIHHDGPKPRRQSPRSPRPLIGGIGRNAVIDSVHSIRNATPWGDWHSLAVVSHGEYGSARMAAVRLPVRSDGSTWEVVQGLRRRRRQRKGSAPPPTN